jgi:hypothetical protein
LKAALRLAAGHARRVGLEALATTELLWP